MSKQKMYAVTYNAGGLEIRREQIGVSIIDEDGRVSARVYNGLKRKALKLPTKKGQMMTIVTEDGRKDRFGGYPADTFVRFI